MELKLRWLLWAAICLAGQTAKASVSLRMLGAESHGGNPSLRSLYREASLQAAAILEQLDEREFRVGRDAVLVEAILEKRADWALDILSSPHHWPADDKEEQENLRKLPSHLRERSAVTGTTRGAPITFSYTMCEKRARSLERAVQVLLHESLHHFGMVDEDEIDRYVDQVYGYWDSRRSPDERLFSVTVGSLPSDIFPKAALKICAGMAYKNDRARCLKDIRFAKFDDSALDVCAGFSSGAEQNECLEAITNRAFDAGAVAGCSEGIGGTPSEKITCLRMSGVEYETLLSTKEGFKATPWFILIARNYDAATDATTSIRDQAKAVCEGWKQIEYSERDWESSECYRTRLPVGATTGKKTADKTEFYFHCSVRTRCTMR